jgi:phosphoserine phosphatase
VAGAYADISVEDFQAKSDAFLRSAQHPTLGRGYIQSAYAPMVELLGYLEANGFSNHMVSGSGADFMRPITQEMFGIPPERVIGSTTAVEYTSDDNGGTITRKAKLGFLDDGPQKPIQIWSRGGRRPLLAGGNSNGDLPMLEFAQHRDRPSLRLLVLHDDADREFAYTSGAEKALSEADRRSWTVVSMKNDWATVF